MMDKEDSTSSPYLLTSTPERTDYVHPEQGQMGHAFTPPNSMSSPIYTPTVFNNLHDEQLNTLRMRQLSLPAEPIAISENAQAPDCSKSLWLDSSSEVLNENSHGRNILHKHSKPTQLPVFGSGNLENMLQKSGVSPIPPLAHTKTFDTRKPIVSHSPSRQQYGYKINDHATTNQYSNQLGFQPIGWGTERAHMKTMQEPQHHSYTASKRSHIKPKFQDKPYAVDGICDIQGAAMNSTRTNMCSSISSSGKSPGDSFVPLYPKPKPIDCTWVDTRPQYSKKNCPSASADPIGCHARGWLPTCKDQPSYEQSPAPKSLEATKCSATQELLTASMCMPKSGQQGYEKSAFHVFSHTSSLNHGGASKRSGVHELKWKDENPVPVAKLPLREVNPNIKTSPSLQSTSARKVLSVLNNESTDSGFDSLHHSTDNFCKSHDEFSSSEDYNLDSYSHKENSIQTKIPEVQSEENRGIEKGSSSETIPKLQRKPDIPQRSASPVDPEFRGVMLQMRTKMEQDDTVQLSIRAFFNCRKSTRLLRKAVETEQRPRTRRDSSSSSDSDYAAELFPKKRRNQAGKQCASCRTKTTPLWRDAEDGTPLCNACGIRYKKYRIRCLSCWHIPRKETKTNLQCTNCGETLKLSFFKTKQWKC